MSDQLFQEHEIAKRETVEINGTTFGVLFIYDQYPEHPRDHFTFAGVMVEETRIGRLMATIGDGPGWNSKDEFLKWAKRKRAEVVEGYDGEFWYVAPEEGREQWEKIYGGKWRRAAKATMEDQAATIKAWKEGDVFGWVLTDESESEQIESCWGFYGEENFDYMLQEATEAAKAYANDPTNRRFILCYFDGMSSTIQEGATIEDVCSISEGKAEEITELLKSMEFGECTKFLEFGRFDSIIIKRTK